ncbi:coiled-coil domain-containing protein 12 [Parasteatoda tepidariorum]|uniref:coiled-coil domain-containing protein 12 n=1 Tax=Parasteatoda tepidariorum TaxID=114398 RepID=UPI00077FC3BF|nr:coiled-coil domain-containing protein 12 [Parasteatoda tepidariorum]
MDIEETSKLEAEALKRRERLRNLKNRVTNENGSENNASTEELPKPLFRNYTPNDEQLRLSQLPKAKPESVEEEIQNHLEAAKPEPLIEEVDLASLAPRKPDWDLKRDVAKKLEKLEKRTQKAIAELIRERLKLGEEDLVEAVNSYSEIESKAQDSDDD